MRLETPPTRSNYVGKGRGGRRKEGGSEEDDGREGEEKRGISESGICNRQPKPHVHSLTN